MKISVPQETKDLIEQLQLRGDYSAISGNDQRHEVKNTMYAGHGEETIVRAIVKFYNKRKSINESLKTPTKWKRIT